MKVRPGVASLKAISFTSNIRIMAITQYLVGIVFVPKGNGQYDCKKYRHNIKNTDHYVTKFCGDMKRKFPTAEFVNFYYKQSQEFKEKIHLE